MTSSERIWIRSQRAAVVDLGEDCVLIARDGVLRRLEGDSANLARAVLAFLARPRSDADVIAHVEALAGLVQREIHTSMWPPAAHVPVPHVALAEWADLVVIYPASATTIARISNGDCSELVAAIATTTRAPVIVVPSMNEAMLDAP